MTTASHPLKGSRWINLKKQTEYTIWKLVDDSQGNTFVIYQLSDRPASDKLRYYVEHTETGKKGSVFWFLEYSGNSTWSSKWYLGWRDVDGEAIAWARPLNLWAKKFKPAHQAEGDRLNHNSQANATQTRLQVN